MKRPHDRELVKINPLLAAWEHFSLCPFCRNPYGYRVTTCEDCCGCGLNLATYPNILNSWMARRKFVHRYAFAVPNPEALTAIAKYSPIIELGAGRGYWALLLNRDYKTDIVAYDSDPPRFGNNVWFSTPKREFYPILSGNVSSLLKHKDRTLFMCWPYMNDMAFKALQLYRGDTVIYVGESSGGCTATEEFFVTLSESWNIVEEIAIPQWHGMHDRLTIFSRK